MKKNLKKLSLQKSTVLLLSQNDEQRLKTGQKMASGEDCPFTRGGTICDLTRFPCTITLQ